MYSLVVERRQFVCLAVRGGNLVCYINRNYRRCMLITACLELKGNALFTDAPHGKKAEFGREVRTINFFHF